MVNDIFISFNAVRYLNITLTFMGWCGAPTSSRIIDDTSQKRSFMIIHKDSIISKIDSFEHRLDYFLTLLEW